PHKSYEDKLDNLADVDGFKYDGIKDTVYAFKLSDEGIYNRQEILLKNLNDVDGFQNEPKKDVLYCFIFSENGKYIRQEITSDNLKLSKTDIHKFNDLEDINGFNQDGKSDVLYLFKYQNGKYVREEYQITAIVDAAKVLFGDVSMPNGDIKNNPIS